jgi:hypothetical protein
MPIGEHIRDDMRSVHANVHEFSMHRDADMNSSLFSFSKFCTLEEQELRMKDDVLDEGILTKLNS